MSDHDRRSEPPPPSSIAHAIDTSGEDGQVGRAGRSGRHGVTGEDGRRVFLGRDRMDGAPGGSGEHGRAGAAGVDGADGGTLTISVSGHPGALQLHGGVHVGRGLARDPVDDHREPDVRIEADLRIAEVVDLDQGAGGGLLRLSATGGKGGHGGAGGTGGRGGQGGKGLRGASGHFDGANGGPGGDGGHGGDGGRGGDGGAGGDGGNGGRITVRSRDARLFALLQTDVRGGAGGLGGPAGKGGPGGDGGAPGRGGAGASSSEDHPFGGHSGRPGRPGRHGERGRNGREGRDGLRGREGRVLWQVVDEAGQVHEQSEERFGLTIEGYKVRGERDDAVFEPGEAVIVHDIALHNPGGLTLPAGARLALSAGSGFDVPDPAAAILDLPALAPGERRVIPGPLHARLTAVDGPSENAPLRASADITLQATLLGRTLTARDDPEALVLQHAVQIAHPRIPPRVLAGEEIRLAFELGNISDAVVEGDDVALRLTLPNALQPTGLIVGATVIARAEVAASRNAAEIASPKAWDDANDGAFTLPSGITLPASGFGGGGEDGGVALRLAVPALAARGTAGIAIGLRVAHEVRPYAAIPWAIELGLRGRAVEIQSSATVAAPRYETASTPAPVLLVGSDAMDEREHLAWARIFETLSLPFDVWDADRQAGARADGEPDGEEGQDAQGGDRDRTGQRGEENQKVQADSGDSSGAILARHAGGLIVLPTPPEGRPELLSLARIVRHFAPRHRDPRPVTRFTPSDAPPPADGGLLVWGAGVESVLAPLFAPAPEAPGHGQDLRRIELRWRRPDKEDRAQLLLGLREELERAQPDRRWRVLLAGEPRRQSPLAWHYGTIQVEGLVLSAGHRLCVVPPKRAGRIGFEALLQPAGFPLGADDQPFLTPRAFTRAFTAVVTALPMPLKLHALRAVIAMPPSWRLENPAVTPSIDPDSSWNVVEVVGRAIAEELAAERRRPVPRSPSGGRADEGGGAGPWAPRIGAGGDDDVEGNALGTAAIQTGDLAALPRLEILREAVLARPDRFVAGAGLRILYALLEPMTDRGPLIALGRRAAIERRRIQRSRAILREIEGAMQAVGAGDGHANGAAGTDERSATRPRRDPRQLARAWRSAPGWAWIEHVTRPGGGG